MSPFVLISCPICHQRLIRDPYDGKEFYFRCPDQGQGITDDTCFHIGYNNDWTFHDITFYLNTTLIHLTDKELHIVEHGRYPFTLNLLDFAPTISLVKTIMVFQ